jgi:hypothetical protein
MKDFKTKNGFFTGNVGIGTTNPTGLLHLESDGPALYITDTTNNTDAVISSNNGGDIILNADLNDGSGVNDPSQIQFKIDGEHVMRIKSNGNVGIGTTNPTQKLTLTETSNGDNLLLHFRAKNDSQTYVNSYIVYDPDADFLALSSGQLIQGIGVDNDGNVGIGTTSPNTVLPLTIEGAVAGIQFKEDDGAWNIVVDEDNFRIQQGTAGSSPTERMRIDSDGNVGIGTSNPTSIFHLEGASPNLKIRSTSDWSATTGPVINLQGKNSSGSTKYFGGIKAYSLGTDKGNLAFNVRKSNIETDIEAMRIDSDGNVGIGTTSPSKLLEVQLTDNTPYAGGVTSNCLKLRNLSQSADSYSSIELTAGQNSGGAANLARIYGVKESTTTTATSLAFTTRKADATINEAMRIDSDGNVGIGTANPSGKLHVFANETYADPYNYRVNPAVKIKNNAQLEPTVLSMQGENAEGSNRYGNIVWNSMSDQGGSYFSINANVRDANHLVVKGTGNVGIGTSDPASKLEVLSGLNHVPLRGYRETTSSGAYLIDLYSDVNGTKKLKFRVEADGDVITTGSVTSSDKRTKQDIVELEHGIEVVKNLLPKKYKMIDSPEKGFKYGFIAQDVEDILPDIVRQKGIEDGEGGHYKALEYNSMIAVLTKAIQEQQTIIEDLKSQNESLVARIEALEG